MTEQAQAVEELVVPGTPGQPLPEQVTELGRLAAPGEPAARGKLVEQRGVTPDDVGGEGAGPLKPSQPCGVQNRQALSPSARRAACTAGRCWTRSR